MNMQVIRLLARNDEFNRDAAGLVQANGIRAPGNTPGEVLLNHLLLMGKGAELQQTALNYGIRAPAPPPAPQPRTTTQRVQTPEERRLLYLQKTQAQDVLKKLPANSNLRRLAADPKFNRQQEERLRKAGLTAPPGMTAGEAVVVRATQVAEECRKAGLSEDAVHKKISEMTAGAYSPREVKKLVDAIDGEHTRETFTQGLIERRAEREREQEERQEQARKEARKKLSAEEVEAMDHRAKQEKDDKDEGWRAHLEAAWDENGRAQEERHRQQSEYIENPRRLDLELVHRNLNGESFEGIEVGGLAERELKEDHGHRE